MLQILLVLLRVGHRVQVCNGSLPCSIQILFQLLDFALHLPTVFSILVLCSLIFEQLIFSLEQLLFHQFTFPFK